MTCKYVSFVEFALECVLGKFLIKVNLTNIVNYWAKTSIRFNARLLTTHTPSAIGPTLNSFVSIYFERTIFADLLKEVFCEFIVRLNKVDSSRITKKRSVCSSYTQVLSFCYKCVEFNKDVCLRLIRGNVGDTL